jgi:hypothetical protein
MYLKALAVGCNTFFSEVLEYLGFDVFTTCHRKIFSRHIKMAHRYSLPFTLVHSNNRSKKSRKHGNLYRFAISYNHSKLTLFVRYTSFNISMTNCFRMWTIYCYYLPMKAINHSVCFVKQNKTQNGITKAFVHLFSATSLSGNTRSIMTPTHTDFYLPKHYAFMPLFIGLGIYI